MNNVESLGEIKNILIKKKQLENDEITVDDLDLKELEIINSLYKQELDKEFSKLRENQNKNAMLKRMKEND